MRLAIITTHPIQYYAPVFELLTRRDRIQIKVFYTWGESALSKFDPGFNRTVNWDLPLLEGYAYEWVENVAKDPGSHKFNGINNPDLIDRIDKWEADALLVFGWAYRGHLKAISYFNGKKPVFFRGDSTLLDEKKSPKAFLKQVFLKWVYHKIDHAFPVGRLNQAYFINYGLKEAQLTFAPHAIDNQRFAPPRSTEGIDFRGNLGLGQEDLLLLFAGKFEEKKAPVELLKVFLSLKDRRTAHLLFVGNGQLEEQLKLLAANEPHIHFLSFQNQSVMPAVYQACDLFCLPSKGPGETWGLAVNEAMACGKAVLVSDKAGCHADLVTDGYNGLVFKSGNEQHLQSCLSALTSSKSELALMGANSKDIIQKWNFTAVAVAIEKGQPWLTTMAEKDNLSKHLLLFIPWTLALLFSASPVVSYIIAWLGSFFIFYITLSGKIRPLPNDRSMGEQIMRPIIIVQIIFASYMCCTSIFFFLNVLGYQYFSKTNAVQMVNTYTLELTAQCQRYYCLGHAAFASGMIFFMKYPSRKRYYIEKDKLANLLMVIAIISFPVSILFLKIPGLSQFYFQLSSLSFIAGTLALALAIPLRKIQNTLICLSLYLFNFYQATISGFKEPIIISVLVLGIFLYPSYKKLVTLIFVPLLLLLFMFLPSYISSFRQNAWSGEETSEDASKIALDAALNNDDADNTNWDFLVSRLSEIEMFTRYVDSTPAKIDFYGTDILKQSAISIVPRVFWPEKPITEDMVMQRVYSAGVVNRFSNVSAKPAFIVDAYLSFGAWGVFIFLFIYGAMAQIIAVKAEDLFGGYVLGTALIFSGLFQMMWRGLSFEFLFNSVFWSYITMLAVFKILKSKNILKEI